MQLLTQLLAQLLAQPCSLILEQITNQLLMDSKFDKAIWKVVLQITAGRVMGYGEVASAAGFPRHARMVSKAMSRSPEPLPWHRVVKANRTIAFEAGSEGYLKQEKLLLLEGVTISNGKVFPVSTDKGKSLDQVLWGSPPDF